MIENGEISSDDENQRTLDELDRSVPAGRAMYIDTAFGTISVHKSRHRGYYAVTGDGRWPREYASTPSEAFLRLLHTVEEDHYQRLRDRHFTA